MLRDGHAAAQMSRWLTMKRLMEYDPAWPHACAAEMERLARAASGALVRLHHIGSTSVPGLCAKNIIDMLGETPSLEAVDAITPSLIALGYEARGEYGIVGRRYLSKPPISAVPGFHLHVFEAGSAHIARHLAFRDHLRTDTAAREEYAALKRSLSESDGTLRADYQARKDVFVAALEEELMRASSSRKSSGLSFRPADLSHDRGVLLRFNIAYAQWIAGEVKALFGHDIEKLLGAPIPDYMDKALDKLCAGTPPDGIFYLAEVDGRPSGMGGLRRLSATTGEIKRIYVTPEGRGHQLGMHIVEQLLNDARTFGFDRVVLETGPFMAHAHRIYEAFGFRDIAPYPQAEVPKELHPVWRFMTRDLG